MLTVFILFSFPTAISITVLALWHDCPLPCSSTARAGGAAQGLCYEAAGLLLSCCECLPQPSPRCLAVLLVFYLPSHSPQWALEASSWCEKAAFEGWLCPASLLQHDHLLGWDQEHEAEQLN